MSLHVAEFGTGAAAPAAGRILASFGAEVVKLELPPAGDWTRAKPPLVEIDGTRVGALFAFLNAGKRSVALDLVGTSADEEIGALWEWADVVLIDDHFLRFDVLRGRLDQPGPTVVTCITPFGLTGPEAGRPATSCTIFARSGEGGITPGGLGYAEFPGASPLVARGKVAEIDAGVMGALASVVALIGTERGRRQPVVNDVSLYETSVSHNRWIPSTFMRTGWVETRASASYPYGGMMPCRDGHVMIMPSTDRFWAGLVEIMGRPAWALQEDLNTQDGRAAADHWVRPLMTEWSRTMSKEQLLRAGLDHGVPIAPYRTIDEVAACPQMNQRGFLVRYSAGAGAEQANLRVPGLPAPGFVPEGGLKAAPALGSTVLPDFASATGGAEATTTTEGSGD